LKEKIYEKVIFRARPGWLEFVSHCIIGDFWDIIRLACKLLKDIRLERRIFECLSWKKEVEEDESAKS
jgi:hypothetical protein